MVLMPVVLVREGRLSDVTPLQAVCKKSLLYVYTHTHWHALSCPLPCFHVWLFLPNSARGWSQRAAHSLLPEAPGNFHAFSPGFSQKAMILPQTWRIAGQKNYSVPPPKKSWDFVWPELLTHIINSFSLMRLYFWKMRTQDTGAFYTLTAAFFNFHFLPVNHR